MSKFTINSNVSNIDIGDSSNIVNLHNVSTNQMSVTTLYAANTSINQMSVSTLYAANVSTNQISVSTLYADNASVNQMSVSTFYATNTSANQMSVSTLYAANVSTNQMSVSTLYAANVSTNQMSVSTLYAANASMNQMSVTTINAVNANFTDNLTYNGAEVATQNYVAGEILNIQTGVNDISTRIVFIEGDQSISGTKNFSNVNVSELNIYGSLTLNGLPGTTGQVLISNNTGPPTWSTINTNLSSVLTNGSWAGNNSIDMNNQNINNVGLINVEYVDSVNTSLYIGKNASLIEIGNIDTKINMSGQVEFFTPPHIPNPILGNDAASKGYVDSLVGQYGGSLNLFMNFSTPSEPPNGYKTLSTTISDSPSRSVIIETDGTGQEQLVASFITPQLNIESIPPGVWVLNINGQTLNITLPVSYIMRVYKYSQTSTPPGESQIGDPATSTSINTLSIGDYYCNTAIPLTPLDITDRIVVKIFIINNNIETNTTITTWFEGLYYSYVSTSLNAGTTMLSSNNIWTGTNDFEALGIKTTVIDSSTSLTIAATATALVAGNESYPTEIYGSSVRIGERTTGITIGNATSNTSIKGIFNASNISTSYINSLNTSLFIGSNTSLIQIGNANSNTNISGALTLNTINGLIDNTINASYNNASSPVYTSTGTFTSYFYNNNANIYYKIVNDTITNSNGGFVLWGFRFDLNTPCLMYKENNTLSTNPKRILYTSITTNHDDYGINTSYFVFYNNVSYRAERNPATNRYDYDSVTGHIIIKINGVQVPIYVKNKQLDNILQLTTSDDVFVNYNIGTTNLNLSTNNSSVNYYKYNVNASRLEIIQNPTTNILIRSNNGTSYNANGWNENGELTFTGGFIPNYTSNYQYTVTDLNYTNQIPLSFGSNTSFMQIGNANSNTSIMGTLNISALQLNGSSGNNGQVLTSTNGLPTWTTINTNSNLSSVLSNGSWAGNNSIDMNNQNINNVGLINVSYINSLNASLYVGTGNTTFIQIGNTTSNTSVFGRLNASNISATFINSLNASIMGNLNASNISAQYIDSLNASLFIGSNTSIIQIGNSNGSTNIIGNLNTNTINSLNNLITLNNNTSSPVYSGGSNTPYFYNNNASIYYKIENDTITSNNGGFVLWGYQIATNTPRIIYKGNGTLLTNPTRAYYRSMDSPADDYTVNCSYFVFYNNVSYRAVRNPATNRYDYDSVTGHVIIKILGVKVPIYTQNKQSDNILYTYDGYNVFVNYNIGTTNLNLSTNNSSVNYYRYNFNTSRIEVINNAIATIVMYNDGVAYSANGWNANGELTFTGNRIPNYASNYQYTVTDLNYSNMSPLFIGSNTSIIQIGNANSNTSIMGNLNASNISATFINSLNASLFIGSNTSLIQIGNSNSNTSILGTLNISALQLNGIPGNNGQVLTSTNGLPTWTTINTNSNLSSVLSNGSWAGNNSIDMNNQNINNVGLINVSYINSLNSSLFIGSNTSLIQIGNANSSTIISGALTLNTINSIDNLITLNNNTSSPVYSSTGTFTSYFFNNNANIYYRMVNDTITSSNGGFQLWGKLLIGGLPKIMYKENNTLISNPTRIEYYSINNNFDDYNNNCSYFVFYNNVSYRAERNPATNRYDYDSVTGEIIIKINGVKVPIYTKNRSLDYSLRLSSGDDVFVNYNIGTTNLNLSTNNSSVNYYYYNFDYDRLELINSPLISIQLIRSDLYTANGWNANGELTFTGGFMPNYISNYQYNVSDLNYNSLSFSIGSNTSLIQIGNTNSNTSIMGNLNASNISAQYINSLNASLFIGSNTSLIQIGNTNGSTNIFGKFNTDTINSLNNLITLNNNISSPVYSSTGTFTSYFYNNNANIYYKINNDTIINSNGGFVLWGNQFTTNNPTILYNRTTTLTNPPRMDYRNITYAPHDDYFFNCSYFIFYNNVSYKAERNPATNRYDYDSVTGHIIIKINGVKVPIYTKNIELDNYLRVNTGEDVFVTYINGNLNLSTNNSSVNYYKYNFNDSRLEIISDLLNIQLINTNGDLYTANGWNANGELTFTEGLIPNYTSNYQYTVTDLNYSGILPLSIGSNTSLIQIGNANSNTSIMGILNASNISATFINSLNASIMRNLNASNISTQYINSLNASLFIGSNTSLIQIGNANSNTNISGALTLNTINGLTDNTINASYNNASSPVYLSTGVITPYFFNNNANIYYKIENDTITSTNGGFVLWGTRFSSNTPALIYKANNTLLTDPTRVNYRSLANTADDNFNCSYFVFYNNVSYRAVRNLATNRYDYDSVTGEIIIKINGVKVPTYVKSMALDNILYIHGQNQDVFVNYNIGTTNLNLSTNNSSVNYYKYNVNTSRLEIISLVDQNQIRLYKNGNVYTQTGWNANGEITFAASLIPNYTSNYQYTVNDLNYILPLSIGSNTSSLIKIGNASSTTSIFGNLIQLGIDANSITNVNGNINAKNISSSYINGLDASLFIGTNAGTQIINIGNSNSKTTIFGNLNASNISATFINSLNASIMGNLNASNISTQYINSLNASLFIGSNTSIIQIGNTNSNTSIMGNLNASKIITSYINSINSSLFIGTNIGTTVLNNNISSPVYSNYDAIIPYFYNNNASIYYKIENDTITSNNGGFVLWGYQIAGNTPRIIYKDGVTLLTSPPRANYKSLFFSADDYTVNCSYFVFYNNVSYRAVRNGTNRYDYDSVTGEIIIKINGVKVPIYTQNMATTNNIAVSVYDAFVTYNNGTTNLNLSTNNSSVNYYFYNMNTSRLYLIDDPLATLSLRRNSVAYIPNGWNANGEVTFTGGYIPNYTSNYQYTVTDSKYEVTSSTQKINIGNTTTNTSITVNSPIALNYVPSKMTNDNIGYRALLSTNLRSIITNAGITANISLDATIGNQTPAGVYLFEIRSVITTTTACNVSLSLAASQAHDGNLCTSFTTVPNVPYYSRLVTTTFNDVPFSLYVISSGSLLSQNWSSMQVIRTRLG